MTTLMGLLTYTWVFRLITEDCYPWEGRMSDCKVPKRKKALDAPCPTHPGSDRPVTTPLRRVGSAYRVSTEEGIMHEILTSGSVQGTRNRMVYHGHTRIASRNWVVDLFALESPIRLISQKQSE